MLPSISTGVSGLVEHPEDEQSSRYFRKPVRGSLAQGVFSSSAVCKISKTFNSCFYCKVKDS